MGKGRYLVLDVGTTAVKASVLDISFQIVGHSAEEYVLDADGDYVELVPDKYVASAKSSIKKAIEKAGDCDIKGISVTTQGETLIPVDSEGRALQNAIVWLDARAEEQAEKIRKTVNEKEFYERTGIPSCNGLCPVSKLLWIKENKPDIYNRTRYFLLLEDYLIYWLCGVFATESSLMSTTGYFDIRNNQVWWDILEKSGLDGNKIPPVYECGHRVEKILCERAKELGISKDAVVATAAMDQVSAAVGAGNCMPGIITETTGTAMCIGATVDEFPEEITDRIPVYRHFQSGKYFLICVCMTAGIVLKWFKDNFCAEEKMIAEREKRSVYELLDNMAAKSEPMSGGMILLPYFSGMLQPYEIPEIRGSFRCVGLNNTKSDFVRSIMEGVGFMLRENLELIEMVSGKRADHIVSMGGAAKGECWCQIKADITGNIILSRQQPETTSIGAALFAAAALGDYESVESAVKAVYSKTREYHPDSQRTSLYTEGYQRYKTFTQEEIRRAQNTI